MRACGLLALVLIAVLVVSSEGDVYDDKRDHSNKHSDVNDLAADNSVGNNRHHRHPRHGRRENTTSFERRHNISLSADLPTEWLIPLPKKSLFYGTLPPSNVHKWKYALALAASGRLVLLEKVRKIIPGPNAIMDGDKKFRWTHKMGDVFLKNNFDKLSDYSGAKTPIVLFGFRTFDRGVGVGNEIRFEAFGPDQVIHAYRHNNYKLPRKIVAIGAMDENWGWASNTITNRTASWGYGLVNKNPRRTSEFSDEELKPFLDDPNLLALIVNQHHNLTHPKVISVPRGLLIEDARNIWEVGDRLLATNGLKRTLAVSIGSKWGNREPIVKCVKERMKDSLVVPTERMNPEQYGELITTAISVLCLPGLGYDTFRLWETLLTGSIPIIERGTGLDRALYKLPVLMVDDFADVTPELVRQAYAEAIYRLSDWDYSKLTHKWWEHLILEIASTGLSSTGTYYLPMKGVDENFTRPMAPYTCGPYSSGSCTGAGTKRVPAQSCAIDYKFPLDKFNWHWEYTNPHNAYTK